MVFGLTPSPLLLNTTLQHHLAQYQQDDPSFVNQIHKSLYVDNVAAGADSDERVLVLYDKLKSRMADGGFNVRKFLSNSHELQQIIDAKEGGQKLMHTSPASATTEDDETYAKVSPKDPLISEPKESEKVLGVAWDRHADEFVVDPSPAFATVDNNATKCLVSRCTCRIFDPLGIIAPVTVKLKLFMQQLHAAGLDWDTPLQE